MYSHDFESLYSLTILGSQLRERGFHLPMHDQASCICHEIHIQQSVELHHNSRGLGYLNPVKQSKLTSIELCIADD